MLLILAQREGKLAIMDAVSKSAGLKTEAGGMLFSLPVDRTVGVGAIGAAYAQKKAEDAATAKENSVQNDGQKTE